MLQIGQEIKEKISERLGEWVTVNIGISTNRFLAKYAAGFDKPDGMTLIDHTNLRSRYENMHLVDLPGINTRFRARLRAAKIYTPLEFLDADMQLLKNQVFKSINGYHWYMRLRGYEADAIEFTQKSIGHQHALSDKTMDMEKLEKLLIKLCEKTGRRLRKGNYYASGIHLYLGFARDSFERSGYSVQGDTTHSTLDANPYSSWHHGEKVQHRLYSTIDIYEAAKKLLLSAEIPRRVSIMSVHVFGLKPWNPEQLSIFDAESRQEDVRLERTNYSSITARKRVTDAVDEINNRYGEFVITPAMMLDMQGTILDRIAFGQVRDL
jgi:DNA polymerase-4